MTGMSRLADLLPQRVAVEAEHGGGLDLVAAGRARVSTISGRSTSASTAVIDVGERGGVCRGWRRTGGYGARRRATAAPAPGAGWRQAWRARAQPAPVSRPPARRRCAAPITSSADAARRRAAGFPARARCRASDSAVSALERRLRRASCRGRPSRGGALEEVAGQVAECPRARSRSGGRRMRHDVEAVEQVLAERPWRISAPQVAGGWRR
jgi:hypothetical protein